MDLAELKGKWNQVLFALEAENRVAWLTFFDARLAQYSDKHLKLDFSDPEKFSGDHSYAHAGDKFAPLLRKVVLEITGEEIEVSW